ncbi:MAG: hypothetical protein COW01_00135 [Bdellovibrionales bacterium CG12_big_fil_rev_8_21_14_0_65_38_15]|nr:MAG: hypothetical protein COW79_14025 [Bdellovibrionales bacterium CG22_combo_CG10-13_8_21_14_all_38_13]PIQ57378.1 MAG: hypothetical protein COW01_00135 [Bdellovibrionales bacterium CG12_big_fil_rev_8_21_14_0_65_38_15]PIR31098.1 MAG: hypothetical protein COV38_01615 [Bdellovibrionales bacterium CG11_big_fil_rev_8_21_14_0_20_38_13]
MRILIVEDNKLARITLKGFLKSHEIEEAETYDEAKKLLLSNHYDLIFLDLDLDFELAGLELAKICKRRNLYSVILTGHEETSIVEQGYTSGARDYLAKPVTQDKVDYTLQSYVVFDSEKRVESLIHESYITTHQKTLDELNMIKRVYLSDKPILIKGPTGTGKTVVAKLIKEACRIPDNKFISLNCASFADNLIESELFGHKKGSFTGADKDKIGLLQKADGGLIFLDEIHSLSMRAQQKLMKAIDEKEFYPVGSTAPVKSNFRIITATCENLTELIVSKEFRTDFYARISHIQLQLYALKDRPADILALLNFYLSKEVRKVVITDEARDFLVTLPFKNNTRDIESLVDFWTRNGVGIVERKDIPAQFLPVEEKPKTPKLTRAQKKLICEVGLKAYMEIVRDEIIMQYLEMNNQHRLKTAEDLGITDRTIRYALNRKQSKEIQLPLEVEYENSVH